MSVTGVGSCVRGEVTRLFLRKGVCRGLYQLQQLIGRNPPSSLRACVNSRAHTQPPLMSLAFMLTAGEQDNVGKRGGHVHLQACFLATRTEVSVAHLLPRRQRREVPIKMTLVGRDGLSDRFTARASAAPRTCRDFN